MSSVAFLALLAAASPSTPSSASLGPCFTVVGEPEICGSCSGFSFCGCAYVGANCPSIRQICNSRIPVTPGGPFEIAQDIQPCYWVQPCKSTFGGPCDPETNPCVTYGDEAAVGSFTIYTQLSIYCTIAIR